MSVGSKLQSSGFGKAAGAQMKVRPATSKVKKKKLVHVCHSVNVVFFFCDVPSHLNYEETSECTSRYLY